MRGNRGGRGGGRGGYSNWNSHFNNNSGFGENQNFGPHRGFGENQNFGTENSNQNPPRTQVGVEFGNQQGTSRSYSAQQSTSRGTNFDNTPKPSNEYYGGPMTSGPRREVLRREPRDTAGLGRKAITIKVEFHGTLNLDTWLILGYFGILKGE